MVLNHDVTEPGRVTGKGKCYLQFLKNSPPADSDYIYMFLIYSLEHSKHASFFKLLLFGPFIRSLSGLYDVKSLVKNCTKTFYVRWDRSLVLIIKTS